MNKPVYFTFIVYKDKATKWIITKLCLRDNEFFSDDSKLAVATLLTFKASDSNLETCSKKLQWLFVFLVKFTKPFFRFHITKKLACFSINKPTRKIRFASLLKASLSLAYVR